MTRYLPILLMVLAALGAGVAIVPGAWEMAFMKLRDKDFAAAERVFEDKFLAGDRSRKVLLPLSELYVRNGRVDKAIAVLTNYSKANPDDRDVEARLAVLLREAQDTPRAIDALEKLAAGHASAEELRELDRLHDIAEDTNGRIRALTRLAKMGAATAQESLILTNLLAASGKKPEALTAAYNAMARYGSKTPHELVQIFSALSVDAGRRDLLTSVVLPWAKGQTAVSPLAAVASALADKTAGRDAIRIVEASMAFSRKDPAAIVLAAQLETTFGAKERALSLYDALRVSGRLPAQQDGDYVALALAQKQIDAALSHLAKRGPDRFSDALLLYAIGQASLNEKTEWLKQFDAALTAASARPLPAGRLALALGDTNRATALAREAETTGPTITLAQLYADLGDLESAARVFDASAAEPKDVSSQDVAQATSVAIALKRGPAALVLAERLVAQDKSIEAAIQRTRALTLNGRANEALTILAQIKATTELAQVAEIEALAAAERFPELRTKLLARLSNGALTLQQRNSLIYLANDLKLAFGPEASSLADALTSELSNSSIHGPERDARLTLLSRIAPLKALPFLKAAAEADPDKQGYVYAKLLSGMKRASELRSFLLTAARTAKTAKVRDDFLYELLKQGAGRDALPLLAERARSDGGKWFFAYDEALTKFGARDERLAALQEHADRPETPRELRLQIAYQLLNLGDKARAEALFRALASDSAPSSPEVRQLAFLWGPRPGARAHDWLAARAEKSPPRERAAWATLLVNAGAPDRAEAVLSGVRDPASIAALANLYAETRNSAALKTLIQGELDSADGGVAKSLAQAADALGLSAEASSAYERAGLNGFAGRAAFFAGEHVRAVRLLSKANGAPESSFFLAEALTALNRPREASSYYRAALSGLKSDGEGRKMRIVALARLKDHVTAERELAAGSSDPEDRADTRSAYAGALLDQGDTRRAAAQLGD